MGAAEFNQYWWEESEEKRHESLFSVIKFLDQNQGYRRAGNLKNLRLFSNSALLGLSVGSYAREMATSNIDRLTLNVIYSMCDTITNKIAKNKIKPMFLTEGGDWSMKRKAKRLTQFTEGVFYETELYKKSPKTFLAATVFGTGALKIYRKKKKIIAEPTFIDELRVEDIDGMHGSPRSLYQTKYISREVLFRMFPKFKAKIKEAKRADANTPILASMSDAVEVVEAWHLPSDEDSKDGVHTICIDNATLFSEEWKKNYFPFVFMRWSDGLLGFFGQGLAEQLTGIQVEINKMLRTMELAFKMCVPHMMVDNSAKVNLAHLSNDIASIIKYSGIKPEWSSFNPVAPQYFEYLNWLVTRAYEKTGISQMSANAQKPAGLDSGKALREFNDIESERFMLLGQAWENFHLECADKFIDLAKEISEEFGDYTVTVKSKKSIEKIKWSEVDMERDRYQLQVFPTAYLSSTPSGRLADIQELVQAGFFPKEFAMKLIDFPDLEWATSLFTAAIDDIDRMVERISDGGEYRKPEPYQNLQLGMQMVQAAILRGEDEGMPDKQLDLLRQWYTEAFKMAPQPGGQPGTVQTGVPSPAPQNNLIPNAPAAA